MNLRCVLGLLAAISLCGCATTGSSGPATPFVPIGEISSNVGGASFSATEVRGPRIQVHRRDDGSWAGEMEDEAVDVSFTGDHLRGVNLMMALDQKPGDLTITGQWQGQIFRFEMTPDHLMVRTNKVSRDLARTGPNQFAEFTFKGKANDPAPPEPQFAFALLATFSY